MWQVQRYRLRRAMRKPADDVASAQFDGTTTPAPVYLNTAYATTTDVDADATQTISGTVNLVWVYLGDF